MYDDRGPQDEGRDQTRYATQDHAYLPIVDGSIDEFRRLRRAIDHLVFRQDIGVLLPTRHIGSAEALLLGQRTPARRTARRSFLLKAVVRIAF